jgi:drug/metabolite transporter (DMT)-like permease
MINAVVATLLFAVSATCANRSARLVGGVEANFWRLVLATLFLALWAFTLGSGIRGQAFSMFFISGMVGIGVGDFGLFQSFPRLGARLTMLLTLCLTTPMAVLMEWIWMGHRLDSAEMGCVAMILFGVVITLWPDSRLPLPREHVVAGTLFALLSAFGGALGAVMSRRAYEICQIHDESIDGPTAAFQRVLGGMLVTAIVFWGLRLSRRWRPRGIPHVADKWRRLVPWVTLNALAGLTIGVSFMQRALETTHAGIVMAIIATTPIAVIPLARVVDAERITLQALVGSLVAVAGAGGLGLVRYG